ncbi:MAG: hypothetical protein V4754_21620, partial [Pseudomonadota bacterium]
PDPGAVESDDLLDAWRAVGQLIACSLDYSLERNVAVGASPLTHRVSLAGVVGYFANCVKL